MLFKNLVNFKWSNLEVDLPTEEAFNQLLTENKIKPCSAGVSASMGSVPLFDSRPDVFTIDCRGAFGFRIKRETKVVPPSALDDLVESKVSALESEGYIVPKKVRASLRDEALTELLGVALIKSDYTNCWLGAFGLWVDTSNPSHAEDIVSFMRRLFGSLPLVPEASDTAISPDQLFTAWMTEAPEGIKVLDQFTLFEPVEDGVSIKFKGIAHDSQEVKNHIEAGMRVSELKLEFKERLVFKIDSNLTLKGIKFLDLVTESKADQDFESAQAEYMADMLINSHELISLRVFMAQHLRKSI